MANIDFGIIGGGISGTALALNLNDRGYSSVVYDNTIQNSKSKLLPYASLNPRYSIDPTIQNLGTFRSFEFLEIFYKRNIDKSNFNFKGVYHFDDNDPESRVANTIQNNPYLLNEIKFIGRSENKWKKDSIFLKSAGWLNVVEFFTQNLKKIIISDEHVDEIKSNSDFVSVYSNKKKIGEHRYVVLCNPQSINKLIDKPIFNENYIGSVLTGKHHSNEEVNLSKDGYILFDKDQFCSGSTYYKHKDLLSGNEKNVLYKKISKWIPQEITLEKERQGLWQGERFTTKQRKPYVGNLLNYVTTNDKSVDFDWYRNIFINTFYGSKGFSMAPYLSNLLIKLIFTKLDKNEIKLINSLSPYQNELKILKKSNKIIENFYYE